MKEKAAHLESLARMTRDNSSEGRQQLLHEITDMFMQQPGALSAREGAYFGEIMGGMVGGVETMVRQHLSETISSVRRLLAGEEVTLDGREVRLDGVRLDQPPTVVPPAVSVKIPSVSASSWIPSTTSDSGAILPLPVDLSITRRA